MNRLTAILALVVAAGCGGSGAHSFDSACDFSSNGVHQCIEFVGGGHTADDVSHFCAFDHGKVIGNCPTDHEIGYCSVPNDPAADNGVTIFYYSDLSADSARQNCTLNRGSFVSDPR